METFRIAELLEPFLGNAGDLEETRLSALYEHISMYIDILLRWNARINLTAIRDPDEIVTRHFGESLFAAHHLFPRTAADFINSSNPSKPPLVADLGSGAGFPGLPIKLRFPNVAMTLIESNHKKATFLREVSRALSLTDLDIKDVAAETLPPSSFHVVTMRAVERLTQILPTASSLLKVDGRLALLISSSQEPSVKAGLNSFRWDTPIPIPCSDSRVLFIGRAT